MKRLFPLLLMGVLFAVMVFPSSAQQAQQENTPAQVIVNYAEIDESAEQTLDVFFTVVDASSRAITAPTIESVQAIFNNQIYSGIVSVPQSPLSITLVLDASGSMQPAGQLMREAAIAAVNTAPQGTRFSVVQFNETIITRAGFSDDRNATISAISSITDDQLRGGTCLYDATFDSLEAIQAAAPAGRRAIILFTDGRDELVAGGELDPCSTRSDYAQLVETARNPQARVPIFTIGLSGTQVINQSELENLALNTGGLSAFGGETELSRLFLQIIQALASQRQVTFPTCVPAGQYSGLLNVEVGDGNLNAPLTGLNFTTTCIIPTDTPIPSATPTPEPLSVTVANFRYNAADNMIEFEIRQSGVGDVGEFRVEIVNKTTGFRVPGDYGMMIVPASGDGIVRVPLDQVPAVEWMVTVTAYDVNGAMMSRSAPAEIAPERTAVPTPTASITPTATATFTVTPTPLVPTIEITSIQFLSDTNEFILNLGLSSLTLDMISGYTIRVENEAGILVAAETRMVQPTTRISFPARDTENRALPPGQYTLWVEIPLSTSATPLRANREVVVPVPPPTPTPTPLPSTTERLVENISSNPTFAVGFVLFALGALVLIIFLILRLSGRRRDYRRRVFNERYNAASVPAAVLPPTPELHTEVQDVGIASGSDGAVLRVIASPRLSEDREWRFSTESLAREPVRIGKGGTAQVDLDEPGVSKLHATLSYESGHFWIRDEGSTNGTYIDQTLLGQGQRVALQDGQMLRFGRNTRLLFSSSGQTSGNSPAASLPVLLPATDLPPGVSARLTMVQTPDPNLQGGRTFEIRTRDFTIGRGPANDLTINSEGVSKLHAILKWVNGQFGITDQRSTNYTVVDGERLQPLNTKLFQQGREYTILLGQKTRLQFSYHMVMPPEGNTDTEGETQRMPHAEGEGSPTSVMPDHTATFVTIEPLPPHVTAEVALLDQAGNVAETYTVTQTEVTFGRKSSNTIVIDNPEVSRSHALIFWRDGRFYVEDLGSGNGTFVGGTRLTSNEPTLLKPGQTYHVRLGRESARVLLSFRYSIGSSRLANPPDDEDEMTQVPED